MEVVLIQASSMKGIYAGYRECWQSQNKSDDGGEKDQAMVKRLLFTCDPVHDSPLEHCLYTWRISGVSRSLSHQLVRHRIASYSQRSQRYVKEDQFEYVVPPSILKSDFTYPIVEEIEPYVERDGTALEFFEEAMGDIQRVYDMLIERGIPKEDARFVLPNACTTSLIVSMNPRAFRNFLKLRLDTHAQWEIRELAECMLDVLPEDHKFMYEDLLNGQSNKTTKDVQV